MASPRDRSAQAGDGGSRARVFFALWPDDDIAGRLHALAGEAEAAGGGRRMRRDTLHLTLAFVGDVARERLPELIAVGGAVVAEPFTLRLDRLGCWRHNRIAWAGAEEVPAPLAALVGRLNASLGAAGFQVEKRDFAPHVTLLRKVERSIGAGRVTPIDWRVGRFVLVESERTNEGAHYAIVGEWPVGAPDD